MKNLLVFIGLIFLTSGEYRSIIIPTDKKCCECDCEYRPLEDVTYYGEDIEYRYKYFGGVAHICLGNHHRCEDGKGIDLSVHSEPHICYGERCDARCCFTFEDYFFLRDKEIREEIGNNSQYPGIPTPDPMTPDH